jgi:carboxypeptidase Taq
VVYYRDMWDFFKNLWETVKTRFAMPKAFPLALPSPTKQTDNAADIRRQEERHSCDAYMQLKLRFRDIGRMAAIAETLGRDFLTAMPDGAYKARLGQIAFLFRRMHEDLTQEKVAQLLDEARAHEFVHPDDWDEWDGANLREMEALYRRHCHIGGELMEQKARLEYIGRRKHQDILKAGDWDEAKSFLQEQIDLNKKIAEAQQEATGNGSAYDNLLRNYMPDISLQQIEDLFTDYKGALDKLLPEIEVRQAMREPPLPLTGHYPATSQMWLNQSLLKTLHFDFSRGGLYETGHNPVEGGTPDDTRLVISVADEKNFLRGLKSALHEGGHGLYIQGLPRRIWRYQPVGQDLGAAMQESQALLVDMIIGRSPEFFKFLSPRVEGLFLDLSNPELSAQNLYRLRTDVHRTVLRRDADEVTYFYHVLLRFNLEKQIFDGDLKVSDLPEAWNAGMQDLLGLKPENPREGILQDVHWFVSKFGYFPSYAVGHMAAAQFTEMMREDIGNLEPYILEGNLQPIKGWLNEHVHKKGRLVTFNKLIKDVTNRPLDPDALIRHLKHRYM